jgi:hypothetical protein
MASLNGTFDATEVAPAVPLEVLPPGKYLAHLIESEMLPTKAGDGQLLKLVFEVLEGPSARRKIFDQLNLVNRNEQTVEIAQRSLSAICHAVGQVHVSDSEQLHFKPLIVTLRVDPAGKDKFGVHREARNKVAGYSAAGATSAGSFAPRPTTPGPGPAPAAPPPPARGAAAAVPPWRRNG